MPTFSPQLELSEGPSGCLSGCPGGAVAIEGATCLHHSLNYLSVHLGAHGGDVAIVGATLVYHSLNCLNVHLGAPCGVVAVVGATSLHHSLCI